MKVKCDGCITLPICISKIEIISIKKQQTYGCAIDWSGLKRKCKYFTLVASNIESKKFLALKYFLLQTKGYFKNEQKL